MRFQTTVVALLSTLASVAPISETFAAESFRQRIHEVTLTSDDLASDVRAEIEFGREVAARILGRYSLMDTEQLNHYVNLVGQNLVKHCSRPELAFHFAVLETPDINAYTAPGGYIFITRGSINLMENEAELAAVLAHEIAHVTQKHIVKELNIRGKDSSVESGIVAFTGSLSDPARVAFQQALDLAVGLLFTEGLKKEDEYEADMLGMLLATSAGYEPMALEHYLDKVKAQKGEYTAVVSTTHPSFEDRLHSLKRIATEEGLISMNGASLQSRFEKNIGN